ncbi:MAG: DUF5345 family protein, partial [Mogibacterium sp.]|nr:DUF5345 family protein [Mogibacterium sp.]
MGQKRQVDVETVRDEDIRERILERRKRQRQKQIRNRRIFVIFAIVIIALIGGLAIHRKVENKRHYEELMVAGGEEWDGDSPLVATARGEL